MVVIIANDLPPAVRGRLKVWFIEPRPNIFVSGIKDSVAKKVVDWVLKSCPLESGLIVFERLNKAPGYRIYERGETKENIVELSGLQLVRKTVLSEEDNPIRQENGLHGRPIEPPTGE